jgi:hypothetical protein
VVLVAAAAFHLPLSNGMTGREIHFGCHILVTVQTELRIFFDEIISFVNRVTACTVDFTERVVAEIPVCGLKSTMTFETSLRRCIGICVGKIEDFAGIAFLDVGITRSMTGFTSFLDAAQFPIKDAAVDIHFRKGMILVTLKTRFIAHFLNNIHIWIVG